MNRQVNNRFREYTIAVPQPIAEQIRLRAREQKVSEATIIKQLIAKGLISTVEKQIFQFEGGDVTLNDEVIGKLE